MLRSMPMPTRPETRKAEGTATNRETSIARGKIDWTV